MYLKKCRYAENRYRIKKEGVAAEELSKNIHKREGMVKVCLYIVDN